MERAAPGRSESCSAPFSPRLRRQAAGLCVATKLAPFPTGGLRVEAAYAAFEASRQAPGEASSTGWQLPTEQRPLTRPGRKGLLRILRVWPRSCGAQEVATWALEPGPRGLELNPPAAGAVDFRWPACRSTSLLGSNALQPRWVPRSASHAAYG